MSIACRLALQMPNLRRYAHAVSGSPSRGDALVALTLEAIMADHGLLPAGQPMRLALFKAFQRVLAAAPASATAGAAAGGDGPAAPAGAGLALTAPLARQALLLSAMEGFGEPEVSHLIDRRRLDVRALIDEALAEIARHSARVAPIRPSPPAAGSPGRHPVDTDALQSWLNEGGASA